MDQRGRDLFREMTKGDWIELVKSELKMDNLDELTWQVEDGVKMDPYYSLEDLHELKISPENSGTFPFTRGYKEQGNHWLITDKIGIVGGGSLEGTMEKMGIDALLIDDAKNNENLLRESHQKDINCFLNGISPELFLRITNDRVATPNWQLGNSFRESSLRIWMEACQKMDNSLKVFEIQLAGKQASAQIAGALNEGFRILQTGTSQAFDIDALASRIGFRSPVSDQYYLEIAKLRALRSCWSRVVNAFEPKSTDSAKSRILSHISSDDIESSKPEEKLIALSIRSAAAIIGACDALYIEPYGEEELAKSMTRNIQLILKHEAFFDRVADPLGGSFSIEALTDKLARRAWEIFKSQD